MRSKLGVAVVGVGRWGVNLVRTLSTLPDANVVGLCDVDPKRLAGWPACCPDAFCTTSLPALLDRPSVQAVAVATPPNEHVLPALMAIERGRHVFVEKPLATSLADAQRLVGAARSNQRVLMVGHILQHHASVRTLCHWVRRGCLGRLKRIETWRLGASRDSHNAWWTLAPHDLSVVRLLLGAPVRLTLRTEAGDPDRMKATLECAGNVRVSVTVAANHSAKVRRLRVIGTSRTVVFDDTSVDKLRVYEHSGHPLLPLPSPLPEEEPLLVEMRSFVRSARQGASEDSDGLAGAEIVKWLEAGSTSLRLGCPVWLSDAPSMARETRAWTA
ncbi:MAG: Gfo/Idh/MocA family oxidoreductase [Polyangiaceae bacterium]|nr:Gfo/Idh/MocA family oxidoreductase [Polyangiaceae bacterium]